jgi:hypothetical protein
MCYRYTMPASIGIVPLNGSAINLHGLSAALPKPYASVGSITSPVITLG